MKAEFHKNLQQEQLKLQQLTEGFDLLRRDFQEKENTLEETKKKLQIKHAELHELEDKIFSIDKEKSFLQDCVMKIEKKEESKNKVLEHQKNSSIRVKIGRELSVEDAKTSLKGSIMFGEKAPDALREQLTIKISDRVQGYLSSIFIFTPSSDKNQQLKSSLRDFLSRMGMDEKRFNIELSGSKLILEISGTEDLDKVLKRDKTLCAFHDLAAAKHIKANFNLKSAIDFQDLLEYHKKGFSTLGGFFNKPSSMDISVEESEGDELLKFADKFRQMMEIKDFGKSYIIAAIPLFILFQFLLAKTDISVNTIENWHSLTRLFQILEEFAMTRSNEATPKNDADPFHVLGEKVPAFVFFPRLSTQILKSSEFTNAQDLIELVEDIECYFSVREIFAVQLHFRTSGLGIALTTPPPEDQEKQECYESLYRTVLIRKKSEDQEKQEFYESLYIPIPEKHEYYNRPVPIFKKSEDQEKQEFYESLYIPIPEKQEYFDKPTPMIKKSEDQGKHERHKSLSLPMVKKSEDQEKQECHKSLYIPKQECHESMYRPMIKRSSRR